MAAGFVSIAAGFVVASVTGWAVDVFRGLRSLAHGTGADEMAIVEQRMALSDLLVVAAYADGRLDDPEAEVLASLSSGEAELEKEIADAKVRFEARRDELASTEARVRAMQAAIVRLDDDARGKLRALVAQLRDGAPARTATATADDAGSPYRATTSRAGTLREELATAFGDVTG